MLRFFVVTLLVCIWQSAQSEVEVGVYFDEQELIMCSDQIGAPVDAYIILSGHNESDVNGWELRLATMGDVYIGISELYGNAINYLQDGEFMVGVGSPLEAVDGTTTLARISVYAFGEGAISIEAIQDPSIDGSDSPIYSFGDDRSLATMRSVEVEGGDGASAIIRIDCDSVFSPAPVSLGSYEIEGAVSLQLETGRIVERSSRAKRIKSEKGWEHLLNMSDFAFIGTVDSTRYWCYTAKAEGAQSVAIARFKVDRGYWGVRAGQIVADVRIDRSEGCVSYDRDLFQSLEPGVQYLAIGRTVGRRHKIYDTGIYRIAKDQVIAPDGTLLLISRVSEMLDKVLHRRDLVAQLVRADFVGVGHILHTPGSYRVETAQFMVERTLLGPADLRIITGFFAEPVEYTSFGDLSIRPGLEDGGKYLFVLSYSDDGGLRLINGMHSVYQVDGGNLLNAHDKVWGALDLVDKILEGNE